MPTILNEPVLLIISPLAEMFDPVILPPVVKLFTWVVQAVLEDILLPIINESLWEIWLFIPPNIAAHRAFNFILLFFPPTILL